MDSDNDGLWTSMYTASQAFRYAATKDPAAKAEALTRFEALLFLYEASAGVAAGFPARSAARVGDTIFSGGTWHNSSRRPGWVWKGDTSSDEVTGHMFVYPLIANLLDLNASQRARVNLVWSCNRDTPYRKFTLQKKTNSVFCGVILIIAIIWSGHKLPSRWHRVSQSDSARPGNRQPY